MAPSEKPPGSLRPFPLLRYFSGLSLIFVLVTAVVSGVLYNRHEVNEMLERSRQDSIAFAHVLSLTLHGEVSALLRANRTGAAGGEVLKTLDKTIRAKARDFNAAKMKIYAPNGATVYSTQREEIGAVQAGNPGVLKALEGEVAAGLVRRDHFNSFDRVLEKRDLLQVYLPVRTEANGQVVGVFELYSDMTALLQRIAAEGRLIMFSAGGILLLLYGGLVLIVHRASRIIKGQGEQLQQNLREISRQNLLLEKRVQSRTTELEAANRKLTSEISERESVERNLAEARQHAWQQEKLAALGRLAAGIVHEVGNPLAAVRGLVDGLRSHLPLETGPEAGRLLQVMDEHLQRLETITHDVTGIAIPPSHEPELTNLNELLTRVANVMRYDANLSGINIALEVDPALPAVMGNPDQLVQVLMNLISNAAEAMESRESPTARITVTTRRRDNLAVVTVGDDGKGMDDETLERAFEPFYTTKRPGEGMGIGLSLCHAIVQRHGGEITIYSRPHAGTTVSVNLPIPEATAG